MQFASNIKLSVAIVILSLATAGCQKMERPSLGDYPKDTNPPGGPLKFYAAFDGTSTNPLKNAVDSIRANFPSDNPFTSIPGISGKAVQGVATKDKAIKYPSANDFASATSFTIAYWMKGTPPADGEPEFMFSYTSKDYWHESALFLLIEKGGTAPGNSTPTQMAGKLAVQDHWVEFTGANRLPNVLNGQWHHVAFVYDQTTSRLTAYVDGVATTNTSETAVVKVNNNPRGPLAFKNTGNFILGGWNKHGNVDGAKDPWIHSYTGGIDQFRLYNKTLSASEIMALFNSKL